MKRGSGARPFGKTAPCMGTKELNARGELYLREASYLPSSERPGAACIPRRIASEGFLCNVSLPRRRAREALLYDVRALRPEIDPRRMVSPPAMPSV
jgi:hypothetical protein